MFEKLLLKRKNIQTVPDSNDQYFYVCNNHV